MLGIERHAPGANSAADDVLHLDDHFESCYVERDLQKLLNC